MFKNLLVLTLALTVMGVAFATNYGDNNTLSTDNPNPHWLTPVTPIQTDADTLDFPNIGNTWQVQSFPYWWHVGDTVFGDYTLTEAADHCDISFSLTYNSLAAGSGFCDFEFRIDGVSVGTFQVTNASGMGPITESFTFAPIAAGTHEIRYYETNLVAPGAGSISINDAYDTNTVIFSSTALERSTWGSIKATISQP